MGLEILHFAQNDTHCHPERSEGSLFSNGEFFL